MHLELGAGALDVLDVPCGESGVPSHRVVLGHPNRSPDLVTHRQAAESGWPLAFDGPSLARHATDRRMPDAVRALADAGSGDRLLLGADTATAAARSVTAAPGCPVRRAGVRPRLVRAVGEEPARRILTENPGRAFGAEWRC